ncbi:MAG: AraC family transcriptional regulator [Cellvibrionaceae bacterium]|nr:AraC family transcriptional regulator [Cellvibrionaceae bacterium]
MKCDWYDVSDRFIAARSQAAMLLEIAKERGISSHRLLRGTTLFSEDLTNLEVNISPAQLSQLFANVNKLGNLRGFSFLYGEGLLPGFSPHLVNALSHAANLTQTLELLHRFPLLAFPMLKLQWVSGVRESGLELVNVFGLTDSYIFSAETALSAVYSWVKWQSKLDISWRFELNYPQPDYMEEYELYLGDSAFNFNSVRCRMMVSNRDLLTKWPKGSQSAFEWSLQQLDTQRELSIQQGFCGAVRDVIKQRLTREITLEQVASFFATSTSSLKRKLKRHNTSFQKLLDQCRAEKAVELMESNNLNIEQLSEALRIPDPSNFRKSFKKWTGYTPKRYREAFNDA